MQSMAYLEETNTPHVKQAKPLQLANGGSAHMDQDETRATKQTLHRRRSIRVGGKPPSGSRSYWGKYGESRSEISMMSKWGDFGSKDFLSLPIKKVSLMRSSLRVGDVPAPSSVSMAVAGLPFQLTAASGWTCRQNSTNKQMTWLDFQAYFLPPHCKARRRQITAGRRAAVPGQSNATSFWRSVMALRLSFL
jgi:hypothetical protein